MSSKHPLRRSCAFCRARKIKCSNETICEACRRQGADCIYDFEPARPKTRNPSQDSTRSASLGVYRGDVVAPGLARQRSTSVGSPNEASVVMEEVVGEGGGGGGGGGEVITVAMALEQRFLENFTEVDVPRSSPWTERIAAYHRQQQQQQQQHHQQQQQQQQQHPQHTPFTPRNVRYTGILSLLTHDLVGLITSQFGSLGSRHVETGDARFFLDGLANDATSTMFDADSHSSNPLAEYGQRQQTQLIDVWYSSHPLSFLVSKTLLLRELRDGTHDEMLLAVMLADANFSMGDDVSVARGHVLLRWATAQLRSRPLRPANNNQAPNGGSSAGVSTRILGGVSTAQALMLLAWNAMCSFKLRRAICYIGLAGRMASEIKEHISSAAAPVSSSRINGIDVFDVEKEIVAYLYWTTYSLSLWAFIQMGNGHFAALLPTSLTGIFLPVTEASSVMIQLDLVSENFGTLQKQKSVIREMWPLAHIASVVAYIFALYPHDADPTDVPSTSFWQEAPLLALQRIQQGAPNKDIAGVCREINRVLTESIHLLSRQVAEASSRNLVLVVYHAMAVQFLFPAPQPTQPDEAITPDVVDSFCASSEDVLRLLAQTADQPPDLFGPTPSLRGSFPDVFCMALDTCARGLEAVRRGFRPGDAGMLAHYEGRLGRLTRRLHDASQGDFLNQGKAIRHVRRSLRACLRNVGGGGGGVSGGSSAASSPGRYHGSLSESPTQSPLGFDRGIPHIAVDASSPYEYTCEPSTTTSSMPSSSSSRSSTGTSTTTTTSFPTFEDVGKPDWQADVMFTDVLDATLDAHALDTHALGVPHEHISIAELVDLQNGWCPPLPNMMDFDMSIPHTHTQTQTQTHTQQTHQTQWDWPDAGMDAAAAADMDSVFYYFDRQQGKV